MKADRSTTRPDQVRREAWDEAMIILLVTRPDLHGEALLVAVVDEANSALARLKESGLIDPPDGDEA